jgi:hypothetical protein
MTWGYIGGAAVAVVGGSLLADDNGAEGANDAAAASTRMQSEIAKDQWNRYKEIYEPLERGMVADAQNYASPENFALAAGDASASVASQFGKARDRLSRTPGLDPSSGAFASSMVGLDLAQAATDVTQQNTARARVKDMAYARKTDALSLGKGLSPDKSLPALAAAGLGSAASGSLAQAQFGQHQSNAQAVGLGRVTDRVVDMFMAPKPAAPGGRGQTYGEATRFADTNDAGWLDF